MGKFAAYKVELSSKQEGKYEQDFVCDTEFFKNMEHPEIIRSDVKVHMDMTRRGDVYDMKFTVKGGIEVPCDRCLDPLPLDVDTSYELKVKYGEDYDDGTDNLLIIPYSDTYLNVAYILADTILLTIPLRHVHPQGQCNRAMAAALHRHTPGGAAAEEAGIDMDAEESFDEPEE